MSVKPISICLGCLILMGMAGFTIAFFDANHSYEKMSFQVFSLERQIQNLDGKLDDQRKSMEEKESRMARFRETEYKLKVFERQYPKFAQIVDTVMEKSPLYGFHPDLILGMIQVESSFDPYALSWLGAYGLMQIRYDIWKDALHIDKAKLFDIEYNIDLGLQILKHYFDLSKGNIHQALHLYNNGFRYQNKSYSDKVNKTLFCMNHASLDSLAGAY